MEQLKVFLSSSGAWSRGVAEALRHWLPDVLQFTQPWISSSDIDKGARWATEVAHELEKSRVGIVCLTPDNLSSRWVLFEAGALSKTSEYTYVCTYLHGLRPVDLEPPVSQFQATEATKEDTRKLIRTINTAYPESPLSAEQCDRAFDRWWPELETRLESIRERMEAGQPQAPPRTNREILEEVLELSRAVRRDSVLPELYYMLSLELRAPVNAILGYGALLDDGVYGPLTGGQAKAIKRLNEAGLHLLELLNEVIDPDLTPAKLRAILKEREERFAELTTARG